MGPPWCGGQRPTTAVAGLAAGGFLISLVAAVTTVATTAPTVASMIGLGVGIDYALLILMRHMDGLHGGLDVGESMSEALATAGRSVVFAGVTVVVPLFGLRLAGIPTFSSFGLATACAVVAAAMLAALTLLPALAGLAGTRLLSGRRMMSAA